MTTTSYQAIIINSPRLPPDHWFQGRGRSSRHRRRRPCAEIREVIAQVVGEWLRDLDHPLPSKDAGYSHASCEAGGDGGGNRCVEESRAFPPATPSAINPSRRSLVDVTERAPRGCFFYLYIYLLPTVSPFHTLHRYLDLESLADPLPSSWPILGPSSSFSLP